MKNLYIWMPMLGAVIGSVIGYYANKRYNARKKGK